MKLYAPSYYKEFICIADKCKHSCCVGWEIDIDEDTVDKYNMLKHDYAKNIVNSISPEGVPHFKLSSNDRCPHLNCKGLCDIILNVGEDYLCEICREHPRFYNDTSYGKEVGLGISCEEACRIVLSSDRYNEFYVLEELEGDVISLEFDATSERKATYETLSDRSIAYAERLKRICHTYGVNLTSVSSGEWQGLISSLEYLNDEHKEIFKCFSPSLDTPTEIEIFCERLLAYAIYRHCSGAESEEEYRASLFFALFCERLFASVVSTFANYSFENVTEIARIISEEIEYSEDNTDAVKCSFEY